MSGRTKNGWTKHPGLYRLFEVGHVVGADMNREFMFEAEDRDTNGVTLVRVYSRLFDVGCAPCEMGKCALHGVVLPAAMRSLWAEGADR